MKYEMRDACFACTTPYQTIGAVGIAKHQKINADLYIFGMFSGYEQVAEKIRKYHIFNDVFAVNCDQFRFTQKSRALMQIISYRKAVSQFLSKNIAYHTYYTTSRAHVKTLMIHELLNRYPQMDFVLYEDGIGTYRPGKMAIITSEKRRVLERLLGWEMMDPEKTRVMAYEPSLVECSVQISTSAVEQMPRICWESEEVEIIQNIFSVNNSDMIHESVIFFDNVRCNALETEEKMDQCIITAMNVAGQNNLICKSHPRSMYATETGAKVYDRAGIPIEAIYATMPDIENRILISCASTAAMTPKLLFGKEPVLIDVSGIIYGCAENSENMLMLNKIKSIYQDKSKVIICNSLEELEKSMIDITKQKYKKAL